MFERKVQINGETVLLRFKPFAEIPGRISRVYTGRIEAQLWAALDWGLVEPKRWPDKPLAEGEEAPKVSTAIDDGIFDTVTMREVMAIHNEWQKAADVSEGESDASNS